MPDPVLNLPAQSPPVPGAHALVIGVNTYPHLSGGEKEDSPVLQSLKQLTSAVPSAVHFAQWFLQKYENPKAPRASLRVLVSGGKFPLPDGTEVEVLEPTFDHIQAEFDAWRKRCNEHPDNIALLYFCGHGFQTDGTYLLAADMGSNPSKPWDHSIDFNTTFAGMRACPARVQCYFIDACQNVAGDALIEKGSVGQTLLRAPLGGAPPRDAPVYQAADTDMVAYGRDEMPSMFTAALVECLESYAASANGSRNPWTVTTASLKDALSELTERRRLPGQLRGFVLGGESYKSSRLCTIAQPKVLASVSIDPGPAQAEATISIHAETPAGPQMLATRGPAAGPWRDTFPPGEYQFTAAFSTYSPCQQDQPLLPPYTPVELSTTLLAPGPNS